MSVQSMDKKKGEDCYFYYYSTCLKGNTCAYRHEPSALGTEIVCPQWQGGNCAVKNCHFRHMVSKKNRKVIQCYWETQPGGCRKPHCVFKHNVPRSTLIEDYNRALKQNAEVSYATLYNQQE